MFPLHYRAVTIKEPPPRPHCDTFFRIRPSALSSSQEPHYYGCRKWRLQGSRLAAVGYEPSVGTGPAAWQRALHPLWMFRSRRCRLSLAVRSCSSCSR